MRTIDQALALLTIKELEVKTLRERIVWLEATIRDLRLDNRELNDLVASYAVIEAERHTEEHHIGFKTKEK